jgi:hypothetical protein
MDSLLLALTGLSVTVAIVTSTIAWRVTQADRRRRADRIAALAAAAGLDVAARSHVQTPTLTPSAMPEAAGDGGHDLHEFMPAPVTDATSAPLAAAPMTESGMFGRPVVDSGSGGRQQGLLAAAAAFAVIVVAGAGVLFVSGRTPAAARAEARPPLELVALSHARTDGQLAVSGLVRNPGAALAVPDVQAEVRVFDAAGILIATRTGAVDLAALAPGQESAFTVPVGAASTAARYRVSFTTGGSMLPHVDRRTNLPAAVTADAR